MSIWMCYLFTVVCLGAMVGVTMVERIRFLRRLKKGFKATVQYKSL